MKHMHSVRFSLIVFVSIIMAIAQLVSFGALSIFDRLGVFNTVGRSPFTLLTIGFITAVILGTLLMIPFTKGFLNPINNIIAATKQIGKGNFDVHIPQVKLKYHHKGEMQELIENFNQMIDQLQSNELLKKDFINNFSHEFKTPIASIVGYAQQLQHDDLTSLEKKEYIDIIVKESKRLTNLSSTILTLSKLENQSIITEKVYYRLDEQIRECIVMLQEQWEAKNIDLSIDLLPITYYGNEEMMHHVWVNLINNAIKFTNHGGHISVKLTQFKQNIIITISDDGIGMDEDALHHIFDKFYQADKAHATQGYGLGLALVSKIISLCEGSIRFESQLNFGTTVTITLNK